MDMSGVHICSDTPHWLDQVDFEYVLKEVRLSDDAEGDVTLNQVAQGDEGPGTGMNFIRIATRESWNRRSTQGLGFWGKNTLLHLPEEQYLPPKQLFRTNL